MRVPRITVAGVTLKLPVQFREIRDVQPRNVRYDAHSNYGHLFDRSQTTWEARGWITKAQAGWLHHVFLTEPLWTAVSWGDALLCFRGGSFEVYDEGEGSDMLHHFVLTVRWGKDDPPVSFFWSRYRHA